MVHAYLLLLVIGGGWGYEELTLQSSRAHITRISIFFFISYDPMLHFSRYFFAILYHANVYFTKSSNYVYCCSNKNVTLNFNKLVYKLQVVTKYA